MFLINIKLNKCVMNCVTDDCVAALKFVPDLFVAMIKMIKKPFTALYADDNVLNKFNKDAANTVFSCNGMNIHNIDLNNIDLDNINYDEDDAETIHIRLLAWHSKFKKT